MNKFICDNSYKNDVQEYMEQIMEKYGVSSKTSEREIILLAGKGNVVAEKLYADMLLYKKIYHKYPYKKAFSLYMKSAGIEVSNGEWKSDLKAYPLSYWNVAYFLLNYKRESFLENCEDIKMIDDIHTDDREGIALELALACLSVEKLAAAVNLVGRVLHEASENEYLFEKLTSIFHEKLSVFDFSDFGVEIGEIDSMEDAAQAADKLFNAAAKQGYVFSCNSLAAKQAKKIVGIYGSVDKEELKENVLSYVNYLEMAADRYETYAANRLGLFYMTGKIISSEGTVVYKDMIDSLLAKEYFVKATVYPDANSAWAYLNLIKYFPKMYEKDLELLNEHMDYIRELNPRVYDIALDL